MTTHSPDSATTSLEAARAAYAARQWSDAYQQLTALDAAGSLAAEDLERLATAAYLVGHDDEFFAALERAYHAYAAADATRAVRCAFWLGLCMLFAGKTARGNGWLARAGGHVDKRPDLAAEAGYLMIPNIEGQLMAGEWDAAEAAARRAVEIGERYAEPDLTACARHLQGRALLGAFRLERGFALLDEVMLDVTGGSLSPIMAGLVYCSVIDACQQMYAVSRAREWTDALTGWCDAQPQMIAFSGICLVHRAEILQHSGQWPDAIHEARRAYDRYAKAQLLPAGAALYRQAEIHRLRGDDAAAEQLYREASDRGFDPQPGLALLRLAQGNREVACGSIRRVVSACDDPLRRARLLSAAVEILLAAGEVDEAREASRELSGIAGNVDTEVLAAMSAYCDATVALAEGDAERALGAARNAFDTWRRVDAPFEAARARIAAGLACRQLGDDDGARLELDAATAVLEQLGAAPELARVAELRRGAPPAAAPAAQHGLTPRELEVLRHVAAGKTNRAIAAELFVSEKTVDRHLSNIFNKLDVSTRTAAAAYAFEHKLT